jgi:hypothetical protein
MEENYDELTREDDQFLDSQELSNEASSRILESGNGQ